MTVEFGVHDEPRKSALGLAVVGRVMAGSVRVGDVFTEAEGPRLRWTTPSPMVQPVCLRVDEVRFFDRLIEEAEEVYGVELLLTGGGGDCVRPLVMLRHNQRR